MMNTCIHTVARRMPGLGRKLTYCCSLASGLHNIAETLWEDYGAALRAYPYDVSRTVLITHEFASARLHSDGCHTAEICITVTESPGPSVVWTWGVAPDNTPNRCSSSPSRSAPRTAAATTRGTSAATRAPPSQLGSQRLLLRTLRKMGEAP